MESILERIAKNTEPKSSMQVIVSDNKTKFTTNFTPAIQLDKDKRYEIALVNLETYYSFPNIDSKNNLFRYSPNAGSDWFDVVIPEGSYDVVDLNDTIQQKMRVNGHYDQANDEYHISISANPNTLRSILNLDQSYQVDFTPANSISRVLGFKNQKYSSSYSESEGVVNILSINSVLVNVDIISGSYVRGNTEPTIYSFFPNVSPGYKIIENPVNLVYLPITMDTIYKLSVTLTDQNGKLLNLRGENLTIRFHIREA